MIHVFQKKSDSSSNQANVDQEILFKRLQILESDSITYKKEIQLKKSIIEFKGKTIEFLFSEQHSQNKIHHSQLFYQFLIDVI